MAIFRNSALWKALHKADLRPAKGFSLKLTYRPERTVASGANYVSYALVTGRLPESRAKRLLSKTWHSHF
jgi:hypothetical protein